MNEFMDFHLVVADKSLYKNCRGYSGCGLTKCRKVTSGRFAGLLSVLGWMFCDHRQEQ